MSDSSLHDPLTSGAIAFSSSTKTFQIGLAMAGAVSAGAYTAGVVDFLFEALTEWEKAKQKGGDDVPMHNVCISAISGASAGGITGALAVLAAGSGIEARELPAVNIPAGSEPARKVRCVLPALYDSWVKRPQLFSRDAGQTGAMLGVRDLETPGIGSLLDCSLLDDIANSALEAVKPPAHRHSFLNDPLHVFLTLTNLDGMHFTVGGERMIVHSDRAHFAFKGVGREYAAPGEERWLDLWRDEGATLDLSRPLSEADKAALREAVLATGAFPFGLRSRAIACLAAQQEQRAWPIDFKGSWEDRPVKPAWPSRDYDPKSGRLHFVTVDGGAIDNEPFAYARYAIRDMRVKQNPREADQADRAVIMIDPFPDLPALDFKRLANDRKNDLSLPYVLGALLPALVNQARFNLKDLLDADDPATFSRFLISPRRWVETPDGKRRRARPYLASEAFQAFGGFLDERFREHDFQLGRLNCRHFLKRHFVLHKDNPLFTGTYKSDAVPEKYKLPQPRRKRGTSEHVDDGDPRDFRPIIPLMGSAAPDLESPPWPKMPESHLVLLETGIRNRLDGLVGNVLDQQVPSRPLNWFARRAWRWLEGKRAIATRFRESVASSLYWSEQIAPDAQTGQTPATPLEYAVLGALTDPNWDFRTAKGIANEFNARHGQTTEGTVAVTEADVSAALEKLKSLVVRAPGRRKKAPAFTLKRRRPNLAFAVARVFSGSKGAKIDDPV